MTDVEMVILSCLIKWGTMGQNPVDSRRPIAQYDP